MAAGDRAGRVSLLDVRPAPADNAEGPPQGGGGLSAGVVWSREAGKGSEAAALRLYAGRRAPGPPAPPWPIHGVWERGVLVARCRVNC